MRLDTRHDALHDGIVREPEQESSQRTRPIGFYNCAGNGWPHKLLEHEGDVDCLTEFRPDYHPSRLSSGYPIGGSKITRGFPDSRD